MRFLFLISILALFTGCSVTSHPDYQKTYQAVTVPDEKISLIKQQFDLEGLLGASIERDPFGKIKLTGRYESEKDFKKALTIAQNIAGYNLVSNVRAANIKKFEWEEDLEKNFFVFINELAKKLKMTVQVEAEGDDSLIQVSDKGVDSEMQFAFGSTQPTLQAKEFYDKTAMFYAKKANEKNNRSRLLIIGHTDDIGSSQFNANLSENRAKSIGKIFEAAGLSSSNIYYQGAGETLPIADNRTEEGRSKNRRVEIVDLSDESKLDTYIRNRQPKLSFYRPAETEVREEAKVNKKLSTQPPGNNAFKNAETPTGSISVIDSSNELASKFKLFDFGGKQISSPYIQVDLGGPIKSNTYFQLIGSAQAADLPINNCVEDRYRAALSIKSLKNNEKYKQSELLPGLKYDTWISIVNGHEVGLANMAVLRDSGMLAKNPTLAIYLNYQGPSSKVNHLDEPSVNVYRGDKALLYRIFKTANIRCIDIVIPNRSGEAPNSYLYYEKASSYFVTKANFKKVQD